MLHSWLATLNAFLEDTCVIFSVAYLLSRGKTLSVVFRDRGWKGSVATGLIFGLLGCSEIVFPNMRAPYVSDTLAVCVAMLVGGWAPSLMAIALVTVLAAVLDGSTVAAETMCMLFAVAGAVRAVSLLSKRSRTPLVLAVETAVAQGAAAALVDQGFPQVGVAQAVTVAPISILANAAGMFLVMLVIRDSDARTMAEQHRIDLERLRTLQVASDLAALRARIRPHFLFNTLTALASICGVDPAQAEASILKLSRLLRRTIATEGSSVVKVSAELDYVRAYTDLQTLRFGGQIRVEYQIDRTVHGVGIPAFAIQTLVENAYVHGFENWSHTGWIRIVARKSGNFFLFAVRDNGRGMNLVERENAVDQSELPQHGLGMIDRQLRLMFGERARLRVFASEGNGTATAFKVPNQAYAR
jgi:Histidine kinase